MGQPPERGGMAGVDHAHVGRRCNERHAGARLNIAIARGMCVAEVTCRAEVNPLDFNMRWTSIVFSKVFRRYARGSCR